MYNLRWLHLRNILQKNRISPLKAPKSKIAVDGKEYFGYTYIER